MPEKVYLSRRNLITLLHKLNRQARGESTACTIIKNDNTHPTYPQSMPSIMVIAVEDDVYYNRKPGTVHHADDPSLIPLEVPDDNAQHG